MALFENIIIDNQFNWHVQLYLSQDPIRIRTKNYYFFKLDHLLSISKFISLQSNNVMKQS